MIIQIARQMVAQSLFRSSALPHRQRGVVAVFTAIALLVLVGFTAMSLDGGHMILNNTRLQDVVDAATLNAAQTLDETDSTTLADAAVIATLNANAADIGYQEIDAALQGGIAPVIEYSSTLVLGGTFDAGSSPPRFVRVTVTNLPLQPWFMQVFGLAKAVTVSAVSGPTLSDPCDVIPLLACGEPTPPYFGYGPGKVDVLKVAAGNVHEIGHGNFQLLDFAEGSGGKSVRINTAGGFECGGISVDDGAETKPGNTVGPLVQGLNSRFFPNSHNQIPPPTFQPDWVGDKSPDPSVGYGDVDGDGDDEPFLDDNGNNQPNPGELAVTDSSDLEYNHTDYLTDYLDPTFIEGPRYERRVVTVPVGECAGNVNGSGHVDLYGFACFFLLQPVVQQGNAAQVYGEFIDPEEFCGIPPPGNKTTKIVLYKDPDKVDS